MKFAEVISVDSIGQGTRVCLDVIDQLDPLEGVFIGNTGHGYIKVLSENRSTETYPARPFRMNVGAIHQYIMLGNDKTTYLSELRPGMEVPIYKNGTERKVAIGRVKVEKRQFLRVVCRLGDKIISATLQSSDSVHVLGEDGNAKPILALGAGEKVACIPDDPGRHLGDKIEEEIEEY